MRRVPGTQGRPRAPGKTRLLDLLTLSAALVALSSPSLAQEAEPEAADKDIIIVTAQSRAQALQDVPIAVQVLTAEAVRDLAGDNIADIAPFIPGLEITADSPTQPRFAIRGISTNDFGVGTDPAVGVYVDGVFSARTGSAVLEFNDIERIEVLKGPQGTLFGRSAAAGAVSIITRKPSEELEAWVYGRFGNFGKVRTEAMLNVPITDGLALRVNGLFNRRNGIFTDAATGDDLNEEGNWAARAQLLWRPTPRTEAIFAWTHDEINQDARPAIGVAEIPAFPAIPAPGLNANTLVSPFGAPVFNDVVGNSEARNLDEYTLRFSHDFGLLQLSAITSYREFETINREDEDGTNRIDLYFDTTNAENNESFYQELRISRSGPRFDWLAGVSFYDETAQQSSSTFTFTNTLDTFFQNVVGLPPLLGLIENGAIIPFGIPTTLLGLGLEETIFNQGDFQSYAIFGDAIWRATDRLNLTFGLRWTRDDRNFTWLNGPRTAPEFDAALGLLDALGVFPLVDPSLSPELFQFDLAFDLSAFAGVACDNGVTVQEGVLCSLQDRFTDFSPRVVIDYQVTDNILLFFNYAQGYKPGGFNSVQPGSRFDNEDVNNFEWGFKSSFQDGAITLNASGFRYIFDDRQAIRLETVPGSDVPQFIVSSSDEAAWGADIQASWRPLGGPVNLFANAQYLNARFQNFTTEDGLDLSGQPTGAPLWSLSVGARYSDSLPIGGRLEMQVAHAFQSACRPNADSLAQGDCGALGPLLLGAGQNRTDLRVRWILPKEHVELGLFANNVFNSRDISGLNNLTTDTLGTPFVSLTPPRFWGGDIRVAF